MPLSLRIARPPSHRSNHKAVGQKCNGLATASHSTPDPDSKATKIKKEAHTAFCRSAPHWEAHHRDWEFFAVAKPCNTILCCCTVELSPLGRGLPRSLHSTTGSQESSGKASSAVRSLPQINTNSNKPHLILWKSSKNFRESKRSGSYLENQHILLHVYLSNLKMEIGKLNRKRKQTL